MPPILATFGIAIIIQNLLLEVFSANSKGLDAGKIESKAITITRQIAVGWLPAGHARDLRGRSPGPADLHDPHPDGPRLPGDLGQPASGPAHGDRQPHLYGWPWPWLWLSPPSLESSWASAPPSIRVSGPTRAHLRRTKRSSSAGSARCGGLWSEASCSGWPRLLGSHIDPGVGRSGGRPGLPAVLAFRPSGLFAKQVRLMARAWLQGRAAARRAESDRPPGGDRDRLVAGQRPLLGFANLMKTSVTLLTLRGPGADVEPARWLRRVCSRWASRPTSASARTRSGRWPRKPHLNPFLRSPSPGSSRRVFAVPTVGAGVPPARRVLRRRHLGDRRGVPTPA